MTRPCLGRLCVVRCGDPFSSPAHAPPITRSTDSIYEHRRPERSRAGTDRHRYLPWLASRACAVRLRVRLGASARSIGRQLRKRRRVIGFRSPHPKQGRHHRGGALRLSWARYAPCPIMRRDGRLDVEPRAQCAARTKDLRAWPLVARIARRALGDSALRRARRTRSGIPA